MSLDGLNCSLFLLLERERAARAAEPRGPLHLPGVAVHRDRAQCDVAHQPDLGHIPSVGERFRNNREFTPA